MFLKVSEPGGHWAHVESEGTTMRSASWATGQGIARLLGQPGEAIVQEMAEFAERCRVGLHLDISSMAAAMLFLQPIIQNLVRSTGQAEWKLAYIISLCLGVKFTTEGVLAASSCHRPVGTPIPNARLFPQPHLHATGFYTGDILHVTDEFELQLLLRHELTAFLMLLDASYEWRGMTQRIRVFRNALLNVALECAHRSVSSIGPLAATLQSQAVSADM
jgi:hypothetical protein